MVFEIIAVHLAAAPELARTDREAVEVSTKIDDRQAVRVIRSVAQNGPKPTRIDCRELAIVLTCQDKLPATTTIMAMPDGAG